MNIFGPSKTIIDRYLYTVGGLIGKKVLDFGCGSGHGCALMRIYGAEEVVGVDNNVIALKEAKENYNGVISNVSFTNSITNFPDNYFDFITSFEVIEHIESKELDKLMIEFKRVCKNNGKMFISTPKTETGRSSDPNHINNFTNKTLVTFLEKHFKNNYGVYSTITIDEGLTQNLVLTNETHDMACSFILFITNEKGDKNGKDKHNINE